MGLDIITNNPYRVLGVLSNSLLKERVGNQNRLAAFAKVGKEVSFPYDFEQVITEKPSRSPQSITTAINSLNLDKDRLKYALFWFIKTSPVDDISLKHLQSGNIDKAKEIFQKKETVASLINSGVLAFIEDNVATGYSCISKVIHNSNYRAELLQALGIANLVVSEDELALVFILELLNIIPADRLLSVTVNNSDRAIIIKSALNEPISDINTAISVAKNVNSKDATASLAAGKQLMDSTKKPLKQVLDIVGATDPQYQMIADNLAKQILQCAINYYNNASEDDIESPRKAMVLQEYALKIAVGKFTKDRCQENCNILKQAIANIPPKEVVTESRKVNNELKKFCQQPDEISYSVTLLKNTKPLLQAIKMKLGVNHSFYLSLSTQVVGNALHNVIEEVNRVQNRMMALVKALEESGANIALLNYMGDSNSPAKFIDSKVKPVLKEAWKTTLLMDSFDMEEDFKTNRYNPNRRSLKEMCDSFHISTGISKPISSTPRVSPTHTTTTRPATSSSTSSHSSKDKKNSGWPAFWIATLICAVIGGLVDGGGGFLGGGVLGVIFVGFVAREIFKEE